MKNIELLSSRHHATPNLTFAPPSQALHQPQDVTAQVLVLVDPRNRTDLVRWRPAGCGGRLRARRHRPSRLLTLDLDVDGLDVDGAVVGHRDGPAGEALVQQVVQLLDGAGRRAGVVDFDLGNESVREKCDEML